MVKKYVAWKDESMTLEIASVNLATVYKLAERLNIHSALARLLVARGIDDSDDARHFLWPSSNDFSDPDDFPNLSDAAKRILDVIDNGEKLFVAGDFDVDGLTATAILVRTIRALGGETEYYIPNRLVEGYDLSEDTVRNALDYGARLLVTVDCGTRAIGPVALARKNGLEVIVTDHHRLGNELPDAPLVNPHCLPEGHPAYDLAGAGVAFKLAQKLLQLRPLPHLEAMDLLPLVALGTVCDVVDLRNENRILVRLGLEMFHRSAIAGLWALLDETGLLETRLNAWHLAYMLGPRLNAAGRLGYADRAAALLVEDDPAAARRIADHLAEFNVKRRSLETDISAEVEMQISQMDTTRKAALVLGGENWHSGVIGIVASRLVERYNRPAVLVAFDGEVGKGSCRSVPLLDIHAALEATSHHLIRFGGHHQAAGFEIERSKFDAFAAELVQISEDMLRDKKLVTVISADSFLPLPEIDKTLTEHLQKLEPLGTGNPVPSFVSFAHINPNKLRVFKKLHLEVIAQSGSTGIRGIGFNLAQGKKIEERDMYSLLHYPILDNWGGAEKIELRLRDLWQAKAALKKFELIDRRDEETYEVVAQYAGKGSAVYSFSLMREVFPANEMAIDEINIVDVDAKFDTLVLYSPPHNYAILHLLSSFLNEGGKLVIASGPFEASRLQEQLPNFYPGKDFLADLYVFIKVNPDRKQAEIKFHPAAVARGLTIFTELDLIHVDGDNIELLNSESVRKLIDSPTYRRCEYLRMSAENIIDSITRLSYKNLRRLLQDFWCYGFVKE